MNGVGQQLNLRKLKIGQEGDPEYKMDMSTKKNFKERDYMDALSYHWNITRLI